jgi:hypothetical protein
VAEDVIGGDDMEVEVGNAVGRAPGEAGPGVAAAGDLLVLFTVEVLALDLAESLDSLDNALVQLLERRFGMRRLRDVKPANFGRHIHRKVASCLDLKGELGHVGRKLALDVGVQWHVVILGVRLRLRQQRVKILQHVDEHRNRHVVERERGHRGYVGAGSSSESLSGLYESDRAWIDKVDLRVNRLEDGRERERTIER